MIIKLEGVEETAAPQREDHVIDAPTPQRDDNSVVNEPQKEIHPVNNSNSQRADHPVKSTTPPQSADKDLFDDDFYKKINDIIKGKDSEEPSAPTPKKNSSFNSYTGKRLDGRYEIQEVLGVGSMAVVYKAYDNIDDRTVAVKILKEEYLADEKFRRRFKNESRAIAVLSHPNIIKVYNVSYGDRLQYIVMEYVEGTTLKEYIEQQGKLGIKETVHFAMQILRALQHAHDKGVVHRNIKPQNIMVLSNGTVKITDFGIARFSYSDTKTMTDSAIGSAYYISPEQARGDTVDERSDIYSSGVVLYEMLTGQLPFQSDNSFSVALMQLQNDPKRPRELNSSIPVGLEQIIMKALEKTVSRRYKSAAEMLLDIEEFKRNPTIRFKYDFFDYDNYSAPDLSKPANSVNITSGTLNKAANKKPKKKRTGLKLFTAVLIIALGIIIFISPDNNPFKLIENIKNYRDAVSYGETGDGLKSALCYGKAGEYKDAKERSFALWDEFAFRETLAAGAFHTVGIKPDGTVVATGQNGDGECNTNEWTDIISVSAGNNHTVGLKQNGTVVAIGNNDYNQCNVEGWTDIVAVCAGDNHTVGLKSDGTVVAVGYNGFGQLNVEDWTDIVFVRAGDGCTYGVKSNGTVVAVGNNQYGKCDVGDWTDIVTVFTGSYHAVGLKSDGTVVAVGNNDFGQCDISNWTDIVYAYAGSCHTLGIKSDGTVSAVGYNDHGQSDVSPWYNMVSVSAGPYHSVGIKSNGTVVAIGDNGRGQCNTSGWGKMALPEHVSQIR